MRGAIVTLLLTIVLLVPACGKEGEKPLPEPERTVTPAPPLVEDARATAARAADVGALVKGNNEFALDLYAQVGRQDGNLFFSPFSISTALAMTYAGARGETASQMETALRFPCNPGIEHANPEPGQPQQRNTTRQPWAPDRLHAAFRSLSDDMRRRTAAAVEAQSRWSSQDKEGVRQFEALQLVTANALWGQKGYGFLPAFLKLTKDNYGAGLREVDFAGDAKGARRTINAWVEEQTQDKIKDLIPPGLLTGLTRLVLTNAIYFKAAWEEPFQERATADAPFTLAGGKEITVPTMHQTAHFGYADHDLFQAMEMRYAACDLAMVVLLPKKKDGIAELEAALTEQGLRAWLDDLSPRAVRVELPKFRFTFGANLGQTLQALGMTDAFGAQADFSGMNGGKEPLYISEVIHKAFVDVYEKGTEAAAATAVIMIGSALRPEESPLFRADHPFLFLIRDRVSGSILFMGRVMNPLE